ncbi:MAG: FHA domain-containing protein, partial [Bifidobacteriaceae bacterium]|nr:FHA domain-containing protein [Bifidobacteriaceae bacterium]
MRQRVSFARSGSQERVLAITADATATVGDVASALSQSDPLAPPGLIYSQPTLRVHDTREQGGRTLDPAALLHEAGVRSGARLELEEAGGRFARVGASGEASAAVVRILTGPQAGQEFGVPAGTSYIGRAHDCDVQLVDPLVSGRHARLVVGAQIELTDLQSVNGLVIGGQQVSRVALGPSDQVLLGDTLISVVALSQAQAVAMGPVVAFNRSPRVVRQFGEHKIPAPKPPGQPKPTRLPWLAMLAPLLMGGIMFALTRELMSVVFIALSPLIMVSTFLDQFIEKRSSSKAQRKVFEEAVEIAREAIRRTHSVERAVRASRCPTAGEAAGAITQLEGLLWTKRPEDPDFLAVRLGMGPSPSKCTIDIPNANETDRYSWNTLNQLKSECELLTDGPVIANLRESGSLGVAGPSPAAADVARGIALQLAAFQAPSELTFAALMSKSSRVGWEWLEWLPHTDARHSPLGASDHLADNQASAAGLLARLADLVDSRSKTSTKGSKEGGESGPKPRGPVDPKDSAAAQPPRLPAVVVLVADDAPVDRARLTSLAERGPDVGVHIIWLSARIEALPAACRTFVIASDAPDAAYHGVTPGSVGEIR